jgi:outer membrane protein assembly factor BamD (BamD/ComL family)
MKSFATRLVTAFLLATVCVCYAWAQGPARGRMEPERDPILETTAKHNLQVARWYLTKRKAYEGARDRLQEIMDSHPNFSRMDEVLFLMGEVHLKLSKAEAAADYYGKLVKDYPESEFAKKAQEQLDKLKPGEGVKQ